MPSAYMLLIHHRNALVQCQAFSHPTQRAALFCGLLESLAALPLDGDNIQSTHALCFDIRQPQLNVRSEGLQLAGLSCLVGLEQTKRFANDFARRTIHATGHMLTNSIFKLHGKGNIERHSLLLVWQCLPFYAVQTSKTCLLHRLGMVLQVSVYRDRP